MQEYVSNYLAIRFDGTILEIFAPNSDRSYRYHHRHVARVEINKGFLGIVRMRVLTWVRGEQAAAGKEFVITDDEDIDALTAFIETLNAKLGS